MLAHTLLPLLALLAFPILGAPVVEDRDVSQEPIAKRCVRGGNIRYVKRPAASAATTTAANAMQVVPSPVTTTSAVQTTTAATPSPTAVVGNQLIATGSGLTGDSATLLSLHNNFRAKYGASALTWNAELATYAANYASKCVFQHSKGPYGENLAAGVGGGYTVTSGFNGWANEASQYNWNAPGFSSGTGHFTQLVWKATTEVGCAVVQCADGTIFSGYKGVKSSYLICEYKKPGNVVGNNGQYFRDNVGTLQG